MLFLPGEAEALVAILVDVMRSTLTGLLRAVIVTQGSHPGRRPGNVVNSAGSAAKALLQTENH